VIYSYRAYGLTINSDIAISALREERAGLGLPDVVMSLGSEPDWLREAKALPARVDRAWAAKIEGHDSPFTLTSFGEEEFFQLAYDDGTRFIVDGTAKRLWGTWQPPLTLEDIATYLVGPIMGFVLRRRGILALHASSVCVSGNAVMLCGSSESGKSTTAAALTLRGIPVLTEDISPVKEYKGSLYVEPGYPRICLWPDVVVSLLGVRGTLPRLTPTWEKCFLALDGVRAAFESNKRPLKAVYLFGPRVNETDAPRIEDLGMRDALLELVQNTYMNWLLDRNQRAAELDVLTRLVTSASIRRIVPHADPARIGVLCELIMKDAECLSVRQSCAAMEPGR
jgi:hypothetical protein